MGKVISIGGSACRVWLDMLDASMRSSAVELKRVR
jgi:hypothetical protein